MCTKPKVTIVPTGGLANRMRFVASGLYIARMRGARAAVRWIVKPNCNSPFGELFEPVRIEGLDVDLRSVGRSAVMTQPASPENKYITRWLRRPFYRAEFTDHSFAQNGDLLPQLPAAGNLYLTGFAYMTAEHIPLADIFVPAAGLRVLIDGVTARYSANTIGVHIRRTDNTQSIANNSVEDYIRRMKAEIDRDPEVKFFLATDDPQVKSDIIATFAQRVVHYDAALTRGSVRGMKDAVVELWCLAATGRIIGSYYSSYSDIAAEMGGIELEIIAQGRNS